MKLLLEISSLHDNESFLAFEKHVCMSVNRPYLDVVSIWMALTDESWSQILLKICEAIWCAIQFALVLLKRSIDALNMFPWHLKYTIWFNGVEVICSPKKSKTVGFSMLTLRFMLWIRVLTCRVDYGEGCYPALIWRPHVN